MSGDTAARAVLRELQGRCSPEADAAIGAFERREKQIRETLLASYSGRELIEAGSRPTSMLAFRMTRHELTDEQGPFDVTLFEGLEPRSVVLFSVGGGGNPERHLPLLSACAAQGFTVVAPHFERLLGPTVSDEALRQRAHRLRLALDIGRPPDAPVVGIGHSIGATTLLALAGARVTMQNGQRLFIEREPRLQRLALMAPATQFFGPPGSLDEVQVAILAWAGTKDTITPPAQAELLERSLRGRIPVDLRVEDGAGHFSFMHLPPPHVPEPLANREAFLDRLTAAVVMFAEG